MQIIAGAKDPLTGKQPQAASEAELRLSLRQAIEARDVADAAARDAKEVADKPDHPAPGDSEHLASASAYHHVLEFAAGEL